MINSQMFNRFQIIAKHGSFAGAAETLFITRSALVQQVKAAEEELGFKIFERSPKGVSLTAEGKLFLEEGNLIFAEYDRLLRKCQRHAGQKPKTIAIGTTPVIKSAVLPAICKEFSLCFPDVRLEFKVFMPEEYRQAFVSGEFDIATEYMFDFCNTVPDSGFIPMFPCKFCVFVHKDNPLSALPTIGFKDLRGKVLLMQPRGFAKSMDRLRDYLEINEPEITVSDVNFAINEICIRCELENAVFVMFNCINMVFPDSNIVGLYTDWDLTIDRGICYHKNCNATVKNFLHIAERVINDNPEVDNCCCVKRPDNAPGHGSDTCCCTNKPDYAPGHGSDTCCCTNKPDNAADPESDTCCCTNKPDNAPDPESDACCCVKK